MRNVIFVKKGNQYLGYINYRGNLYTQLVIKKELEILLERIMSSFDGPFWVDKSNFTNYIYLNADHPSNYGKSFIGKLLRIVN